MLYFFLFLIAFIYFFIHPLIMNKIEVARYWSKGLVPPRMRHSTDNLTLIYISLAGLLLKENLAEQQQKARYVYKFILENLKVNLPLEERDGYLGEIKSSLMYAAQHPIQLNSVIQWLKYIRISEKNKLQLIRFLAEFAYTNNQVLPGELKIITQLSRSLNVADSRLNEVLNSLKSKQGKQEKTSSRERENRHRSHVHHTTPSIGERERCCKILGISPQANFTEIKKSYRKLVLIYHPDRFINASKSDHDSAQKKFIEIQSAYEKLEKMKL